MIKLTAPDGSELWVRARAITMVRASRVTEFGKTAIRESGRIQTIQETVAAVMEKIAEAEK